MSYRCAKRPLADHASEGWCNVETGCGVLLCYKWDRDRDLHWVYVLDASSCGETLWFGSFDDVDAARAEFAKQRLKWWVRGYQKVKEKEGG